MLSPRAFKSMSLEMTVSLENRKLHEWLCQPEDRRMGPLDHTTQVPIRARFPVILVAHSVLSRDCNQGGVSRVLTK